MRDGLLVDLWKKFKFVLQGLFGITALLLFFWSAGINIGTWVYPGIARFNSLMFTHLAVLILPVAYSLVSGETARAGNRKLSDNSPAWVQAVWTGLFAYLLLCIGFSFICGIAGGAHKEVADGALEAIPSEKSSKSSSWGNVFSLRFFSCFWMLFSFHTAVNWFFRDFTARFGRYDGVVKKL